MRLIFLFLSIFFFSCHKEDSCKSCNTEQGYVDAIVLDTGPLASDGCGWVVRIGNDQYYHPDALNAEFMQNNLNVKICYELTTDQFHCGIAGSGMPVIHVLEIRK